MKMQYSITVPQLLVLVQMIWGVDAHDARVDAVRIRSHAADGRLLEYASVGEVESIVLVVDRKPEAVKDA